MPGCLSRIHLDLAERRFDLSYMPMFGESPPTRILPDRIFQYGAHTSLPKGVTTASELLGSFIYVAETHSDAAVAMVFESAITGVLS